MPKSIIDYTIREFTQMTYEQWASLQKEGLELIESKIKLINEAAKTLKNRYKNKV